jgi:hypothetical protein
MRRIPDHGLIEIADLHIDAAVGGGNRPEVTNVTVTANWML